MDTAAHIIERDIIPFLPPYSEIWISLFASSPDPNFREISKRFVIAKDYDELDEMTLKVTSTGLYADIGRVPWCFDLNNCEEEYRHWYRSSNSIPMAYPFTGDLTNKKWPLKKVLCKMSSHLRK